MKLDKWLCTLLVSCSLLVGSTACDKDDDDRGEITLGAPVLTGIAAPDTVATSDVFVSRKDLDNGTVRVMAYGFCYDTSKTPTIHSATVTTIPEDGKMTATLTGLTNNTVYRVRAFATLYPTGVVYSPEVEMTVGAVVTPAE
uniref:Fibronectin type-III domain-containing protein n=1 Tax=termite gut metagenome TaxID=433724 RepID=S0DFI3_9ZZZZ